MSSKLEVEWPRPAVSRRVVIQTLGAVGAGLVLGCRAESVAEQAATEQAFSMLLRIGSDNRITVVPPAAEMGQDVYTSQAAILAEELDVGWQDIGIEIAPYHSDFAGARGQATGGSDSIRQWYLPLRQLGAAARHVLLEAAAARWHVEPAELTTERSFVVHRPSQKRLPYGALAAAASRLPLSDSPVLKDEKSFRLIGRSLGRKDSIAKTDGTALFGADIRLPGQLYAAVRMPPAFAGKLESYDREAAASIADIEGVFVLGEALAVVANSWWRAQQALDELSIRFDAGEVDGLDDASIERSHQQALDAGGALASRQGSPEAILRDAVVHEARYEVPYLAHVCMEPMTATVAVQPHRVIAYAPTQSPERFAKRLASQTGRNLADITMHNTFLGGGFGRKGLDTVALDQAAELSTRLQRPVQVIWDRPTDIAQDQFRPAAHYRFRASLDGRNKIDAVDLRVATQSLRRARFPAFVQPDMVEIGDDFFVYQSRAHQHIWSEVQQPVNVGFWRAVGHSSDPFATECFMDELAVAANADPIEYRLQHLNDKPRTAAVLRKVAAMAAWEQRKSVPGRGLGVAVQEGWDSVCAQIIEVESYSGELRVIKIWAAVDCGLVISPDTVEAQVSGAVLFALSAALTGQVSFAKGASRARNFDDYPILKITDTPPVRVAIVESQQSPGGVGELGVPACAPALANAVYAATGQRIRKLPLLPQLAPSDT